MQDLSDMLLAISNNPGLTRIEKEVCIQASEVVRSLQETVKSLEVSMKEIDYTTRANTGGKIV